MRKVRVSNVQGVMCPSHETSASTVERTSIAICAMSMMMRRSQMSAMAPDGSDSSMMGSVVEACTSATMSGEGASEVMSQEAPTDWIRLPKFDTSVAVHTARNTRD
jgi:hypothetical protein